MVLLTLILLTFVYLILPKVFKIDIEFKDFFIVNIRFKVISFYIRIFNYKFPNRADSKKAQAVKKKKRKRGRPKVSLKSFYKLFKIFLSVSIIKIEKIVTWVYCTDIFVLSILSGIIYSIWGILLSCGEKVKIDYKGFTESNFADSYFKINLKLKIFPVKILINSKAIVKNLRGVLNYDTSN
ncbi:hypothetical protein [Caldicellulosiruptor sp. DIB 104C]|uniref:hypothetical protein n=1 Tax=Caldicellulosiruptor sp. DIB 104C TaxID=3019889 RepID=UPI0023050AAC|nr:hypothetical protein [Caldicellulosiruptor sp. DIB 104C]